MKITFFSNFLNHHQLPLCLEFMRREDMEFIFVATERIPQERLNMKYTDMNAMYPFVLRSYENSEAELKAKELGELSDIVIIGSAPGYFVESRLKKKNKLTYRYCERSLRKGSWRRFIPRTKKRLVDEYLQYIDNELYVLGASAYTASDLTLCGYPQEKCFKWGYFPKVDEISDTNLILQRKKKNSLIWSGRFLEWKHPEFALKIVESLKKSGLDISLTMIGDGPLRKKLEAFVYRHNLCENVVFTGYLTPEEVRGKMLESEVFLLTSDFYEGWGAVLNEAMNSMCVPIVSHACGSSLFLVQHEGNGFVYRYGNLKEAVQYIRQLLANNEVKCRMAEKAYWTMINEWNANSAVDRLLALSDILIKKERVLQYTNGPCSPAPLYNNNGTIK